MKVCNVKRYALVGPKGRIDKENVKVLREKVLLEESYIESVNARTKQNGVFIQVLDKETKKRDEAMKAKLQEADKSQADKSQADKSQVDKSKTSKSDDLVK
jgi:hypothetical protein